MDIYYLIDNNIVNYSIKVGTFFAQLFKRVVKIKFIMQQKQKPRSADHIFRLTK